MFLLLLACLQTQELIDRLEADSIEEREEAEKKLEKLGKEAIPALEKLVASGALEERNRARSVLHRIQISIQGRLVTLTAEGEIETWDAPDFQSRLVLKDATLTKIQCLESGRHAVVQPLLGDLKAAGPRLVDLETLGGGVLSPVRGWSAYSPDGKLCFDIRHASRLEILDGVTGRKVAELGRSFFSLLEGAWSPDGSRIALTALFREKEGAEVEGATFFVKPDGTEVGRLSVPVSRLTWSPDSKELVCLEYEWPKLEDKKVLRVDVATGRTTVIADGAWGEEWPRVSPDGRRVVFVRLKDRQSTVCVAGAHGARVREVARGHSVRWSPDGERLAFIDAKRVLTILPPEGGTPVRLKEVNSFDWVRRRP